MKRMVLLKSGFRGASPIMASIGRCWLQKTIRSFLLPGLCAGLALISPAESRAQVLLGITDGNPTFVRTDPPTGQLTSIAALSDFIVAYTTGSSDPNTYRYFAQVSDPSGAPRLLVLDTRSGAVLNNLFLPVGGLASAKFDPATGVLFGISFTAGTPTFLSINPETGRITEIAQLSNVTGVFAGNEALDSARHLYFVHVRDASFASRLLVLDTQTGSTVANSLLPGHAFWGFEFDPTTGDLFALSLLPTSADVMFARLDPMTGGVNPIASLNGFLGPDPISALDSATHRYFIQVLDFSGEEHLLVLDSQTGAVLANPILSERLADLEFVPPPAPNQCGRGRVQPVFESSTDFSVLNISDVLVECDPASGSVTVDLTITSHWKAWYKVSVSAVPSRSDLPAFFLLGPSGSRTFRITLRRSQTIQFLADATFFDDSDALYAIFATELIYRAVLGGPLPTTTMGVIWDTLKEAPFSKAALIRPGLCIVDFFSTGDAIGVVFCISSSFAELLADQLVTSTFTASGIPIHSFGVVTLGKRLFRILEFLANESLAASIFPADTLILTAK